MNVTIINDSEKTLLQKYNESERKLERLREFLDKEAAEAATVVRITEVWNTIAG